MQNMLPISRSNLPLNAVNYRPLGVVLRTILLFRNVGRMIRVSAKYPCSANLNVANRRPYRDSPLCCHLNSWNTKYCGSAFSSHGLRHFTMAFMAGALDAGKRTFFPHLLTKKRSQCRVSPLPTRRKKPQSRVSPLPTRRKNNLPFSLASCFVYKEKSLYPCLIIIRTLDCIVYYPFHNHFEWLPLLPPPKGRMLATNWLQSFQKTSDHGTRRLICSSSTSSSAPWSCSASFFHLGYIAKTLTVI
jgi:hypothetical protein